MVVEAPSSPSNALSIPDALPVLPLQDEVSIRELGQKITSETQQRMSRTQRDFFLREQLRSIQHELGEGDDNPEITQLRSRLQDAHLPPEALREAERELDRLAAIPRSRPNTASSARTSIGWSACPGTS